MNLTDALNIVIKPGLELLPAKMNTPKAVSMLLTIGQQESGFEYRRQNKGPARGFYQFELGGGVRGVLTHPASKPFILPILDKLRIEPVADELHGAITFNDALATVCARLLLYTDPYQLPELNSDYSVSWEYYIRNWRPGKPHRQTWDSFRLHAVETVISSTQADL